MHQQAVSATFADLAQAAPVTGRGRKIDLGGILDRQDMPAGNRRSRLIAPALDQAFHRHLVVGQQAMEPDLLLPFALTQPAQANVLARDHASEQHPPLLSRRRSRNWPSDRLSIDMATPRIDVKKCRRQNHTPSDRSQPLCGPEFISRTFLKRSLKISIRTRFKMCAYRSRSRGEGARRADEGRRGTLKNLRKGPNSLTLLPEDARVCNHGAAPHLPAGILSP